MKLKDTFVLFPSLSTDRLVLRMLQTEDAEKLSQLYAAPEVNRWLDWDGPETPSEAQMVTAFFLQQYKAGKNLRWAIADKATDTLMGTVLLSGFQKNLIADIGYDLATEYWGKGYMYEALSEVIRFAFEDLSLARIQAYVRPENTPSLRLLEKLGFYQEGLLRKGGSHESREGLFDVYIYGLIEN